MHLLWKCCMRMVCVLPRIIITSLVFLIVMSIYYEVLFMSDSDNDMCAGCQAKGLFIQLHAVFKSHANLAKYFYQCLFSNCRYSLPHLSRGYNTWSGACYVCYCPGKHSFSVLKRWKMWCTFCVQLSVILQKENPSISYMNCLFDRVVGLVFVDFL